MRRVLDIILNNKRWIIVFIALIVFFAILEDVFEEEILMIDTVVYKFAVEFLRSDILTVIMQNNYSFWNCYTCIIDCNNYNYKY